MKYFLATIFILCAGVLFLGAKETSASVTLRSFGGKITSTSVADVTCYTGTGPVTQEPAGDSIEGPYLFPYGKTTPPQAEHWVLGLYNIFPNISDCETDSTPPVPYTTFKVSLYGISRSPAL